MTRRPRSGGRSALDVVLAECDSLGQALRHLCAAGLAEPRLWLMAAACLSAGQSDRLALATVYARVGAMNRRLRGFPKDSIKHRDTEAQRKTKTPDIRNRNKVALGCSLCLCASVVNESAQPADAPPVLLLLDEFASRLDRLTARVLAGNLRRWVNRTPGVAVVVASAHDDLADALAADWIWVKTDAGLAIECRMPNAKCRMQEPITV